MAKGISINIGLNFLDPVHYNGWPGKLNAPEMDAIDMYNLAKSVGYQTTVLLLSASATYSRIVSEITKAASALNKGDILFLSYSGHGGRVPDRNDDEPDGTDETWCLYDGELIDDKLYELWALFNEGVRIFVLSDSCHSGSILKTMEYQKLLKAGEYLPKFMPDEISQSVYLKNYKYYEDLSSALKKPEDNIINCTVKLISACQDYQEAKDGHFNSDFTRYVKDVWNGGKFKGTYADFYAKIKSTSISTTPNQTPNYFEVGSANPYFDNQKPFII